MIVTRDKRTRRTSKNVSEIFQDNDATLPLELSKIESEHNICLFNYPVLFQISREGKGAIIENEQLNIYASGKSIAEAKKELSLQFDHSYKRLNALSDIQLNQQLLSVKEYYNIIISR
jgi:hypothetical protein